MNIVHANSNYKPTDRRSQTVGRPNSLQSNIFTKRDSRKAIRRQSEDNQMVLKLICLSKSVRESIKSLFWS